jgi:hypothetical protein
VKHGNATRPEPLRSTPRRRRTSSGGWPSVRRSGSAADSRSLATITRNDRFCRKLDPSSVRRFLPRSPPGPGSSTASIRTRFATHWRLLSPTRARACPSCSRSSIRARARARAVFAAPADGGLFVPSRAAGAAILTLWRRLWNACGSSTLPLLHPVLALPDPYWLSRCEGWRVLSPEGRVGTVTRALYGSHVNLPDALLIQSGLFRRRTRTISIEQIDRLLPATESVILRPPPDEVEQEGSREATQHGLDQTQGRVGRANARKGRPRAA